MTTDDGRRMTGCFPLVYCHIGILAYCFVFLHSCSTDPQVFDPQVFHYNQSSGISSLDPAFARDQANIWAVNALYNSLLQLDDSLHIRPCIARSWDISDDGLTYTFHLRGDVWFHPDACFRDSTRQLTAADVAYSLGRIRDPKTASPGAWIFNGRIDSVMPFSAIDDTTFILRLSHPFLPMLGILTMQYCSVIPHEAVEKYGPDFRSHPVGTGPFRMKIWREGSALILVRNETYFERVGDVQLPYIKGVRISFINNKKTTTRNRRGRMDQN